MSNIPITEAERNQFELMIAGAGSGHETSHDILYKIRELVKQQPEDEDFTEICYEVEKLLANKIRITQSDLSLPRPDLEHFYKTVSDNILALANLRRSKGGKAFHEINEGIEQIVNQIVQAYSVPLTDILEDKKV